MLDFHSGPVFKTLFLFIFYFIYLIFWPSCAAAWKVEAGILVLQPGIHFCPLQRKHRILTAGPPGIDSTSWVMQPKTKQTKIPLHFHSRGHRFDP